MAPARARARHSAAAVLYSGRLVRPGGPRGALELSERPAPRAHRGANPEGRAGRRAVNCPALWDISQAINGGCHNEEAQRWLRLFQALLCFTSGLLPRYRGGGLRRGCTLPGREPTARGPRQSRAIQPFGLLTARRSCAAHSSSARATRLSQLVTCVPRCLLRAGTLLPNSSLPRSCAWAGIFVVDSHR